VAFPQRGFSSTDSRSNLEVLVFVEGVKLENPAKNPQSKDENQQQSQPKNMTLELGIKPGPHWWEALVLSPLCHPCAFPASSLLHH